jgi:GPI mannosyltransferase 1 subunit M
VIVKYTDIDYKVFTDAARHVTEGESPYLRSTYRYTPLLAYILTPNITIHPSFGKYIFVMADLLVGYLLYLIITLKTGEEKNAGWMVGLWLLNPFSVNVSTRGNAEAVIALLVVLALYYLFTNRWILSAVVYGLSVHFKIYPIVYCLSLFLWIWKQKTFKKAVLYGLISGFTTLIFTIGFYYLYGMQFLDESYLYHLRRQDLKHNFSVYFYALYLGPWDDFIPLSTLAFLPQVVSLTALSLCKASLELRLFLTTLTFVAFNKVCTVQYFIWYLSLFPLTIPYLLHSDKKEIKKLVLLFILWFVSHGAWLVCAFFLEFLGQNYFLPIWLSGIFFFVVNICICVQMLRMYHAPTRKQRIE